MSSFSQGMTGYVAQLGNIGCRLLFTMHYMHYIGYSHPHLTVRHSRLSALYRVCGGGLDTAKHTYTPRAKPFPIFLCFTTPVTHVANSLNSYVVSAKVHTPVRCTLVCAIYSHSKTDSPQVSPCIHHCCDSGIYPHGPNRGLVITQRKWGKVAGAKRVT